MAADVSSIVRIMEAYEEEAEGKRRGLFTRNLLGDAGGSAADSADVSSSRELDLGIQVPSGWERRLDLMSGKTYLHKMDSGRSLRGFHDLNLPPPPTSANTVATALSEDSSILDLKLAGGGSGGRDGEYLSVCTLEKVKSALERASRCSGDEQRRREAAAAAAVVASSSLPASPSSSTTSSSMKRRAAVMEDDDGQSDLTGGMMAAACPSCLLYVLISKANPRCPGCDSHVPVPFLQKKLKFDLNSS